jgi:solute:Na+ symporter, SSS family
VLACGTVAEGRKALALSAVLIFPLFLIFLLVGVMLWVYFQGTGHPFQIPLPEGRPGIKSVDFIFPIFMMTEVPHILKGFLIVAILSAAMSSISSAITALASVSTMDFIRQMVKGRDEEYFLRFSKYSTVFWALMLVGTAWLTRQVTFVLNAAFSLRGLTAGALLGGLILALFWRRVGARAAMMGMVTSVVVMVIIYGAPNVPGLKDVWARVFGAEIFWPWFTLIGTTITLSVAWLVKLVWPEDDSRVAATNAAPIATQ